MKTRRGLCGYAGTPWIWHRLTQYLTPPFDLQWVANGFITAFSSGERFC